MTCGVLYIQRRTDTDLQQIIIITTSAHRDYHEQIGIGSLVNRYYRAYFIKAKLICLDLNTTGFEPNLTCTVLVYSRTAQNREYAFREPLCCGGPDLCREGTLMLRGPDLCRHQVGPYDITRAP